MLFKTVNPYTEEVLSEYEGLNPQAIEASIENSNESFLEWKKLSIDVRLNYFEKLDSVLKKNLPIWSKQATLEMGKPISQSEAEVEKCGLLIRYYLKNSQSILADRIVQDGEFKGRAVFEPLGVLLGIMPWNFPYWQALRFAVPSIIAGNTVLLKHATATSGCGELIEKAFLEAGFPTGVYTDIRVSSKDVESILKHPYVKAVSLTGSTEAGRSVAEIAGRNLKKAVLELGGSDAYLVLKDADINLAIDKCSQSRMINNGQSCVAAKRFIVHKSLYENFLEGMKHNFSNLKLGDPLKKTTTLGPLARKDLAEELEEQIIRAIGEGAKLIRVEMDIPSKGAFVAPQILTDIKESTETFKKEFFGPVALVFSFDDESEALRIANSTSFGLGGAIFSKDVERAQALARQHLNSGLVSVNDLVKSDPRLPFGGVNESGYGRELGEFGLLEFVNIKTLNF